MRRFASAALLATACASAPPSSPPPLPSGDDVIRTNLLGYLPDAPKIAVLCSIDARIPATFRVVDATGKAVIGSAPLRRSDGLGGCAVTARIDFTAVNAPGDYRIEAGAARAQVRVSPDAYAGAADTLLAYMRQQRSLYNPVLRDSVHHRTDAILVDHVRAGERLFVAGGWADAADYLQYVTTSAHATFVMLAAYRDYPRAFGDGFARDGTPGANGVPDVLDEARWGLEWLVRMHPEDDMILNQIGDDRDHSFLDLPNTDSSDYGWGRGGFRPVYPCTAAPQGLFQGKNRSTGKASTAGKMAAAFALGAEQLRTRDRAFSTLLARKALTAYAQGRAHPGVCQTAPGRAPYFYEEDNWVDDMELAAAELFALTRDSMYLRQAHEYAAAEPVTPWMGADTANHYQWYPWHNYGHFEVWRSDRSAVMTEYYRRGIERVASRADNGFNVGIPFIWCSNDLMAGFATQALQYRHMSGSSAYRTHEQSAIDWILGANPWGTSMVVGLPAGGDYPIDPHSVMSRQLGHLTQKGGLVDGPVYRSIFSNLQYVNLHEPDEYAQWNTGSIVYHDDWGDYSTNEPIMDGTAVLIYLLAAMR
jgi:endoglucanase